VISEEAEGMSRKKKLLSQKHVEEIWGIPGRTLEGLRVRGGGAPYIKLGRNVYYRPTDIEAWIDSNRRRSTSDSGQEEQ